jgi:hypothetical protein
MMNRWSKRKPRNAKFCLAAQAAVEKARQSPGLLFSASSTGGDGAAPGFFLGVGQHIVGKIPSLSHKLSFL